MAQPAEFTWGRTFVGALTGALERHQRQKQFNAELAMNQQAAEALANYRLQTLAQQAEQLEVTRRGQQQEYAMWKGNQQRDDAHFQAGLVNGMTPQAAATKEELGQKKVMVTLPDGQKIWLPAKDAATMQTQLQVSENYSKRVGSTGGSSGGGDWKVENQNFESMTKEELDQWINVFEESRRTERNLYTGGETEGAMPAGYQDAYARAKAAKARLALQVVAPPPAGSPTAPPPAPRRRNYDPNY